MQRLAICLEYDGSAYHGWQRQPEVCSIQAAVEDALAQIANHPVNVIVAGRTDAKVHARNQVIHFDVDDKVAARRKLRDWVHGGNWFLPDDVSFLSAHTVPNNFDARRSAIFRRYLYVIHNSAVRPCLLRNKVTWCFKSLEEDKMQQAANSWLGKHDFSSFRAKACQARSPIREVTAFKIERKGKFIFVDVQANAFLHHMIRNFVGVLLKIGKGAEDVSYAREVLLARDRSCAANTAEAAGLYLLQVGYPVEFGLPVDSQLPGYMNLLSG